MKQNKIAANLPQNYTEAEKAQARQNIGLAAVAHTGDYNDLINRPPQVTGQVQSNWAQTNETAVDFIKNKPTIPTPQPVNDAVLHIQKNGTDVATFSANSATDVTANITVPAVNNGTLTIQKNGSTIETFSANSASNKIANIVVPTKTSDLSNDSDFITSADLPTVNDGTLTIKLNGTNVQTFSANDSENKTANIVLPQAYAIQQARESYYPSSNSWPVIGQLADDGATTVCSVKFPTDVVTKNITVSNTGNVTFQQTGVYHIHLEIPVEVTHAAEDTAATTNYVYATAAVYSTGSYDTKGWTEVRGNINRRLSELNTYWIKVDLDAVVGDLNAVLSCELRLHGLNLPTNNGLECAVHRPIGSITRVC